MTEYVGLFSGGKDSMTASHFKGVKEVIFCHTGMGVNEEFVKDTCKELGWKLNIVYPVHDDEYERFVKKYGFPKPTSHTWIMNRLKSNPVRSWYAKERKKRDVVLVSGIRLKESRRRAKFYKNLPEVHKSQNMKFTQPIKKWSKQDVADYIEKHNLPISPTYEITGVSGDCFCGAYSKKHENLKLMKYYPELAKKIQDLENKYNLSWGTYTSITDCTGQRTLEGLICNECLRE